MKKRLKKYLATSLVLGSSAIAAGASLTGCAEIENNKESKPSNDSDYDDISNLAYFNWNPSTNASDPGSLTNLSIDEDNALTASQVKFNKDLAEKILINFNKLNELNESKKISFKAISKLYEIYFSNIKNESLKNFAVHAINDYKNLEDVYSAYYDIFSQKNLLPTEDEINYSYKNNQEALSKPDKWKSVSGVFAVFYTDPMDILMIVKLMKTFPEYIKNINENFKTSLYESINLIKNLLVKPLSKESSAYQTLMFYKNVLDKI